MCLKSLKFYRTDEQFPCQLAFGDICQIYKSKIYIEQYYQEYSIVHSETKQSTMRILNHVDFHVDQCLIGCYFIYTYADLS